MKYSVALSVFIFAVLAGCVRSTSSAPEGFDVPKSSRGDVYVQLGIEYLKKGQTQVALENFEKALDVDSRNSEAHNGLAVLYERLGENETALGHYRKAVSLRPTNAGAHNNLGRLLCSMGRYQEADERFRIAYSTHLYKRPWIALTNAGRCARQNNNLQGAEDYLRSALENRAEFPPALMELAQVNFDSKKYFTVRAFLQRYHGVAQFTAESLWLGIQSEHELGNVDDVNRYIQLLVEKFPTSDQMVLMEKAFPGR